MFLAFSYVIVKKPKMKNWTYRHSTGFLNYTIVLTNRYIATRQLFPNYEHLFYQWSKQGFRITATLTTHEWCESDVDSDKF